MGIIDTLQRIIRPQPPAIDAVKAGAFGPLSFSQSWLRGMDFYNRLSFKYPDAPEGWINAVRSNVWAFNCINARANAFSAVPLKLYKKSNDESKEDECIEEHEILDLLETVNDVYLDRASFRHSAEWQRAEQGQAIIQKVYDGSRKPKELYILPAHLVTAQPDARLLVGSYQFNGQYIDRDSIIRWYYIDASMPINAMSPTSVAVRAINRYNVADIAAQAIDEHGGRGGGIIGTEINLSDPDVRRYMDEWNDINANPERAGEDRFLPSGMKYETGTLSAQQMQREERANRLAKEIMAAYGVPPSLAGDYSDASVLANAAQQDQNFWRSVMTYELASFADTLTYYLLWKDWPESKAEGLYLAHDLEEVAALQDDELKESEVARAYADRATVLLAGGVASLNEAREIVEMEPIDDERADEVLPPEQEAVDPAEQDANMVDPVEEAAQIDAEATSEVVGSDGAALDAEILALTTEATATAPPQTGSATGAGNETQTRAPSEPLNGAQVQALVQIIQAVADGSLPAIAARELIMNAFPQVDVDSIDRMIDDAVKNKTKASPAIKSDTPGVMGPKGNIGGGGGKFDENKVKRDGGKFAAKEGGESGTSKKKKKVKKTPEEKAAEKAAKKVEKAQERLNKLTEDEGKLRAALQSMQGKDDPSNLRKRLSKALDRVAAQKDKMKGIIDSGGKGDGPSEADRLAAEAATKAYTATYMPIVDFVGMTATDTSGTVLGQVERIARQGQHDGFNATPANPAVYVAGKAYRGADVRVMMEADS